MTHDGSMTTPETSTPDAGSRGDYSRWTASRRHPADVTADRLVDHSMKYGDKLDGHEKDAIGEVIHALREIAEGER